MVTATRLRSPIAALATPRTLAKISAGGETAKWERRALYAFVDNRDETLPPSAEPVVRPLPAPHTLSDESLPDDALATAILLASRPSLANLARSLPLPADVSRLIRIAAGSPESLSEAVHLTGKDPTFIYAAAVFYLEEVLWAEGNDCRRLLGVAAGASRETAAENVRWLAGARLRHLGGAEPEAVQLDRVLAAWVAFNAPDAAPPPMLPASAASRTGSRRQWQRLAAGAAAAFVLGFAVTTGAFTPLGRSEPTADAQPLRHPVSTQTRLQAGISSLPVSLTRVADARPLVHPLSAQARLQPDTSSVAHETRQAECASRECVP